MGRRFLSSKTVFRTRGALSSASELQDRRRLLARSMGWNSEIRRQTGASTSATLGGIAGLVMGCLVGSVGRGLHPSESVFRPRGALPSACQIQERRRLSFRQLDYQTKGTQGQNERGPWATVRGTGGLGLERRKIFTSGRRGSS